MGRNRIMNPGGSQQSVPFSTGDVAAPAANTAAVVTYTAFPGQVGAAPIGNQPMPAGYPVPAQVSHTINGFLATVDAGAALAASPEVTVEDGAGNFVFRAPLTLTPTGTGARFIYSADVRFPTPKRGTAGRAMIITLPAQGAGNFSRLNVHGHWSELA
jgi:hypothetical protein